VLPSKEDPVEYSGGKVFVGTLGPVTEVTGILESQARRAIVYLLATHGPLTLKELSEILKLAPSTIHDHLKRLKEAGIISEAEEHPKKFKVEVYYRLNIPFLLASELNRLKEKIGNLINDFSKYIEDVKEIIAGSIKNADLRCLRYKDPSMYERVVLVLLVELYLLIFKRYISGPIAYVLINDLEESESGASTSS
jgi:DNA-binding transcriptional ArsR family regulator